MAYEADYLSGPLYLGSKGAAQIWVLHTDDTLATVNTDAYISDGVKRGMKVGDLVFIVGFNDASAAARTVSHYGVSIVLSLGTTAVDLADGTAFTATDTD